MMARWTGVALCLGLAACAGGPRHHGRAPHAPAPALLYSPNGEPLNGGPLGQPSCRQAMAGWFARVDAGHDGRIDRGEFLADARAAFLRMDVDHLGFVTSDELERFRRPYRQGTREPAADAADPVLSADTDLDFKVTPEEFLRQAGTTFDRLDANHDGALEAAELEPPCRAEEAQEPRTPGTHSREMRRPGGWP